VAGGGPNNVPALSAHLDSPQGVALDPSGGIHIAASSIVYKVDPAGLLTVIAGNGSSVPGGDGGPATAAGMSSAVGLAVNSVGDIFISDADAHQIRRVSAATGIITTYAGTGVPGVNPGGDGD